MISDGNVIKQALLAEQLSDDGAWEKELRHSPGPLALLQASSTGAKNLRRSALKEGSILNWKIVKARHKVLLCNTLGHHGSTQWNIQDRVAV